MIHKMGDVFCVFLFFMYACIPLTENKLNSV